MSNLKEARSSLAEAISCRLAAKAAFAMTVVGTGACLTIASLNAKQTGRSTGKRMLIDAAITAMGAAATAFVLYASQDTRDDLDRAHADYWAACKEHDEEETRKDELYHRYGMSDDEEHRPNINADENTARDMDIPGSNDNTSGMDIFMMDEDDVVAR